MGLSHERIFRRMIRRMSSFSNTSRSLYTSFVYAPNTLVYALTTSHTAKPPVPPVPTAMHIVNCISERLMVELANESR